MKKRLDEFSKDDPSYKKTIKEISNEVKDRILKHVMVRRTRKDVLNYFKEDIKNQGIVFPDMQDPEKIVYNYEGNIEKAFNQTISLLAGFKVCAYIPLLYYTGNKSLSEFEKNSSEILVGL